MLSGFLSGSETAITATSKARIIYKIKKGSKRATYVLKILENKDNVISSLLLSNNLVKMHSIPVSPESFEINNGLTFFNPPTTLSQYFLETSGFFVIFIDSNPSPFFAKPLNSK